jgi:hypothetical protein
MRLPVWQLCGSRAVWACRQAYCQPPAPGGGSPLLGPPAPSQVEELKQQIRILQAVGYNTVELDDGSAGGRGSSSGTLPTAGEGGSSSSRPAAFGGSLEAMLLSKNRHLEHELTMARLKVVDSKQELDAALTQVGGACWSGGACDG